MNKQIHTGESNSNKNIRKEITRLKIGMLANIPKYIAIAIIAITVLMTFADFELEEVCTLGFALKAVAFVGLSYLMYYTEKYIGRQRGLNDSTYLEERKKHSEKCKTVEHIEKGYSLSDFCEWWCSWEINKARKNELASGAVTEEEWKKYEPLGETVEKVTLSKKKLQKKLKKEKITEEEYKMLCELKRVPGAKRLAIVRACLMKKKKLTPTDILYESVSRDSREKVPINIRKKDLVNDIISLAPLTILMFGVLAFLPVPTGADITLKTIIYGLVRVLSLLVTAFKGDMSGETIYTVDSVENFKIQCHFLDMYEVWKAEKKGAADENCT